MFNLGFSRPSGRQIVLFPATMASKVVAGYYAFPCLTTIGDVHRNGSFGGSLKRTLPIGAVVKLPSVYYLGNLLIRKTKLARPQPSAASEIWKRRIQTSRRCWP